MAHTTDGVDSQHHPAYSFKQNPKSNHSAASADVVGGLATDKETPTAPSALPSKVDPSRAQKNLAALLAATEEVALGEVSDPSSTSSSPALPEATLSPEPLDIMAEYKFKLAFIEAYNEQSGPCFIEFHRTHALQGSDLTKDCFLRLGDLIIDWRSGKNPKLDESLITILSEFTSKGEDKSFVIRFAKDAYRLVKACAEEKYLTASFLSDFRNAISKYSIKKENFPELQKIWSFPVGQYADVRFSDGLHMSPEYEFGADGVPKSCIKESPALTRKESGTQVLLEFGETQRDAAKRYAEGKAALVKAQENARRLSEGLEASSKS